MKYKITAILLFIGLSLSAQYSITVEADTYEDLIEKLSKAVPKTEKQKALEIDAYRYRLLTSKILIHKNVVVTPENVLECSLRLSEDITPIVKNNSVRMPDGKFRNLLIFE